MSGHACPLCNYMYTNGPLLKTTDRLLEIHIESEHEKLGMLQCNGSVHCPVIGCGMISSSMTMFRLHCKQRHNESGGPYRCDDCHKGALPFNGREELANHLMACHRKMFKYKDNSKYAREKKRRKNNSNSTEHANTISSFFPVLSGSNRVMNFHYG